MELHIETWCKAADPKAVEKIVFLHGLGGIGALWRPIASMLESRYFVMAPDQRAHGKSLASPSDDFSPMQYGIDLRDTFDAHGFSSAWMVGHSMGVRSACAFAEICPERVNGLVLIDLGFTGIGGGIGETLERFLDRLPDEFENREDARRKIQEKCPDPAVAQYLMAGITITNKDPKTTVRFPFQKDLILKTLQDAEESTVRDQVMKFSKTNKPILALRGERSLVWKKRDYDNDREFFRDEMNVHFKEIKDSGHGLPFEKRKEFVEELLNFMRSA